jgi:hypothetical protein
LVGYRADDNVGDVRGVIVVVFVVVAPGEIPVVTVGEVLRVEVVRKGLKAWVVGRERTPVGTAFIIMLRAIASTPVWIMSGKIMI